MMPDKDGDGERLHSPRVSETEESHITSKRSTIDQAKQLVRRSSSHLKQLLDPKAQSPTEMDLDLDSFYYSRLRRRTRFAQEITNTLLAAGVPTDVAVAGAQEAASPSKRRGMHMTLSPGEEYENYQKVCATMLDNNVSIVTADALEEEDEEFVGAEPDRRASQSASVMPGPHSIGSSHDKDPIERGLGNSAAAGDLSEREDVRRATGTGLQEVPSPRRGVLHTERTIRGKEDLRPASRMIDPLGRFRLGWDITSICFIFYNAFVLPFKASFDVAASDNGFEAFLDVFFMIDIVITFNTAVDRDGSIRYDRQLAASRYLRSWFAVDMIAALPYGYIFTEDGNYSASLRKSVKLLRLIRLLRLLRISRILRRIQNAIFIRSTLSSLMKYCLMVVFISHWFSCTFHAIAEMDIEHSWITAQGLEDPKASKWDRYVAALYFSVQTLSTIGFGDISGQSANERLFCIFAMIVGGGIFAYGITNIVELVSSLTVRETRFRQKMDEVNEYMSARELPVKLRMEIREFYHNTRQSRESKLNSEPQILNDLSSKLRSKIALSINDQFLRKFPFFTGSEPNFLMELALNMRVIHFAPLEDAIIEGEIGHEMFFIFHGAVEVVKKSVRIGILGENQYFGEMAILSPDNRRTATVRTLCFCELRMLSRARFLEALALFPAMQGKMAQIAQGRAAATQLQPIQEKQKPPQPAGAIANAAFALTHAAMKQELVGHDGGLPPLLDATPTAMKPLLGMATPLATTPTRNPSTARLRLQDPQRKNSGPFAGGVRATTSARISSNVRRSSSSSNIVGVSPGLSIMISEVASLLEEATRRQELLVAQVLKLKGDMDKMRTPIADISGRMNGIGS